MPSVIFSMTSAYSVKRDDSASDYSQAIVGRINQGGSNPWMTKMTFSGSAIPSNATITDMTYTITAGSGTVNTSRKEYNFRSYSTGNYSNVPQTSYSAIINNTVQLQELTLTSMSSGASAQTQVLAGESIYSISSYLLNNGATSFCLILGPGSQSQTYANLMYISSMYFEISYSVPSVPDPSITSLQAYPVYGSDLYVSPDSYSISISLADVSQAQSVYLYYSFDNVSLYHFATLTAYSGTTSLSSSLSINEVRSAFLSKLTSSTESALCYIQAELIGYMTVTTSAFFSLKPLYLMYRALPAVMQDGSTAHYFYKDSNSNNHVIPSTIDTSQSIKFYMLITGKGDSTVAQYKRILTGATLYITGNGNTYTYAMNEDNTSANYRRSVTINFSSFPTGTYTCYAVIQTYSSSNPSAWQDTVSSISFTVGSEAAAAVIYYNNGTSSSPSWIKCAPYVQVDGVWKKVKFNV